MTPSMQQVFDLIDSIAGEWDGCEYEDAMIPDIGQAIRQAGRPRINALFLELSKAATGAQGDAKDAAPLNPVANLAAFEAWLASEYPDGLTPVERHIAHDGWDGGFMQCRATLSPSLNEGKAKEDHDVR